MANIQRQDEFIRSLGVEAYRVGGSVRDEILGRKPKDADYVVRGVSLPGLAEVINHSGERVTPLKDRRGQQFGWRTAKQGIEIALPRKESNAGPGRAQRIIVDPNLPLEADAQRRDFTFNALYRQVGGIAPMPSVEKSPYDPTIIDPTGYGLGDLRRRIIRTTHHDSFRDDPLRILRALRFISTLDADLAPETGRQMREHAHEVNGLTVSGHTSGTVYDEFSKLLMGQVPDTALRVASDTHVLHRSLPELAAMIGFDQGSRYHDMTTDEHTFVALQTAAKVEAPLRVRWALLFHDSGKPQTAWTDAKGYKHYYAQPGERPALVDPGDGRHYNLDHEEMGEILWRTAAKRMNVDRRMMVDVATLIRNHMVPVGKRVPETWVRRKRVEFGDELLRDLLLMRACDLSGKGNERASHEHLLAIKIMENIRRQAVDAQVPASVKELEINGDDAKEAGLEGKDIGDALKRVLDEVVVDPTPLKRQKYWQRARLHALCAKSST